MHYVYDAFGITSTKNQIIIMFEVMLVFEVINITNTQRMAKHFYPYI
jgi:hypothetical protein